MKKLVLINLLAFALIASSCEAQGKSDKKQADTAQVNQTIDVDVFQKKLDELKDEQLIDVRTPTEFEEGHLKDAVNIDWRGADFAEKAGRLDKSKPVMVYCLSGGRSAAAAARLKELGFTTVYNMDGGYLKWTAAGKPVVYPGGEQKSGGMTLADYKKFIVSDKPYVLVDFTAKWCRPCQQMLPMLNKVSADKKDKLSLLKVDADEHKGLLSEKKIDAIPYFELYKNGKLVWKHQGAIDEVTLLKETGL